MFSWLVNSDEDASHSHCTINLFIFYLAFLGSRHVSLNVPARIHSLTLYLSTAIDVSSGVEAR